MHVRQFAWLQSRPEKMPEGRRAKIEQWHGPERAAAYDVPPGPLEWLVDLWHDAGQARVEVGAMGGLLLPLDWRDIAAWVEGAGEHDLSPTFRRAIIQLSAAYAEASMAAQELACPAPYDPSR